MEIKTTLTCPLGHKCEEIRDGAIHRCAWLVELAGRNPTTGLESNEKGCGIAWLPILLIENAGAARSTSAAVESFRNEMVKANESSQEQLAIAAHRPLIPQPASRWPSNNRS